MKQTQKSFWTSITLALLIMQVPHPAFAETPPLEKKSTVVATLLAIDPIPGDALAYAGKPVQASVDGVIGAIGLAGIIAGAAMLPNGDHQADDPGLFLGRMSLAIGIALYAPAYIWDLAGGISGVADYNHKIDERNKKHSSILEHVQPTLAVSSNGGFAGVRISF